MADLFGGQYYPAGIEVERAQSSDTLWLHIVPRQMVVGNLNRRTDNVTGSPVNEPSFWFLMPNEFSYSISHTWSELTTPASALREIKSKFSKQANIVTGSIGKSYGAIGDKADNPHLYENTDRREFKLSFDFAVRNDTYNDVFYPIQKFIEYSCPNLSGSTDSLLSTEFVFPYVFSLQTYTGDRQSVDILSVKTVGITSILPTYRGPWIDGYPSFGTVDIDFVDLNPLYRSTFGIAQKRNIKTGSR